MNRQFVGALVVCVFASIGSAWADCSWTAPPSTSIMYTAPCDKVGINTSTPRATLDVRIETPASGTISGIGDFNGFVSRISAMSATSTDKTGFWANFLNTPPNTNGIAAGMTMGRYGSSWGTYIGFHTHPDNANAYDSEPEVVRIDGAGRVGVGTTNPLARLDLAISSPPSGTITKMADFGGLVHRISVNSATTTDKTGYWANFYNNPASPYGIAAGVTMGRYGSSWGTYIGFHTHPDNSNAADDEPEVVRIDASGVNVTGNVTATGNIAAKYQDVAEWVLATSTMEPGTVVVLNRERANEVMPSSSPYDGGVAGVVSARPGLILGEASESKAQIATTGRVKVRVDASSAPIRVGDLLVTSGKRGVAMRSEPVDLGGVKLHRPGTLIGKALEPLDNGEGEILVLLSLQ